MKDQSFNVLSMLWTTRRRCDTKDGLFEDGLRKQRTRKQRSQSLDIDSTRYSWRELFRNSRRGNKDRKELFKSMTATEELPDWTLPGLRSLPEDHDLHTINEHRNVFDGSHSSDQIPTKAQFFSDNKTDTELDGVAHVEVEGSVEEFIPTKESHESRPQFFGKPKKTRSRSLLAYVANLRIARQRRFSYKKSRCFSMDDEELLERCLSNKDT